MNILVLYYTQSGQLRQILDSLTKSISERARVDFAEIKPERPFPFPWSAASFFDAMPEAVLQIPPAIQPMPAVYDKEYDLVIFGFQPWFLSPSQPITGFLKSEWANVLKGKPVITLIGCRNMWLNAQEKVKADLKILGASHCGHIVLEDRHSNLTSLMSIIRWMFKGQKEAIGNKPEAGVSTEDMERSKRFGPTILQHLEEHKLEALQEALLKQGAIALHPNLIVLEKRGVSQFPKWAKRARDKGGPGDPARRPVIKLFQRILMLAIFVLSPITSLIAQIQTALTKKALLREVLYFKSVRYEAGKLGSNQL
jgi:hypothetical protein